MVGSCTILHDREFSKQPNEPPSLGRGGSSLQWAGDPLEDVDRVETHRAAAAVIVARLSLLPTCDTIAHQSMFNIVSTFTFSSVAKYGCQLVMHECNGGSCADGPWKIIQSRPEPSVKTSCPPTPTVSLYAGPNHGLACVRFVQGPSGPAQEAYPIEYGRPPSPAVQSPPE